MPEQSAKIALTWLDWAIMAAYLLGLIGMGLYYRRFAGQDLAHFFLAGRKLKGWINGVSNAATCMNADVAPAYCGMAVVTGVYVCWFYFSRFGLSLLVAGLLLAVFWRRLGVQTSPEFYELRFSGRAATVLRVWMSFRGALVGVVIWIGAGLLGLAKITEPLIGWERWETFAVVVPGILFYVFLSGYVGVVVSDVVQAAIMIVSSLVLMGMVWADFGGPAGLHAELIAQFGEQVVNWHPPPRHEWLGVLGLAAWTLGSCVGYGGDLGTESQKLLSCRSPREASKMYIWTQIVLFAMLAVLTLPALGALLHWPGLRDGTINKEHAFGLLLGHYLPPGLLGLALVALLASIMSTVDSHMNFAGQVFINDIYQRFVRPTASARHYLWVGRAAMCAIMGLALLVATAFENVIDISLFMLGLFGAELAANWAQWWWWRCNGWARLAACIGGPVIFWFAKAVVFNRWFDVGSAADYIVVLTAIGATGVLWVAVALLTPPDPRATLVAFYRQARPLGWWGPIAAEAGLPHRGVAPLVQGALLAVLGLVAIAGGTLAFSLAYVGQWRTAGVSAAVCLVGGIVFKWTYGRFLDRLETPSV